MRLRNIPGADEKVASSPFCIQDPRSHKGNWADVFGNENPIHIEIGMGKGRFLMNLAELHPDINYISIIIDIHSRCLHLGGLIQKRLNLFHHRIICNYIQFGHIIIYSSKHLRPPSSE